MHKTTFKGFTLVEMIVVIVIVMILAGLAAVSFNTLISETRDNVAELTAQTSARNLDALAALDQSSPQDYADANSQTIIDEAEAGAEDLVVTYDGSVFTFSQGSGETATVVTLDPGDSIGGASAVVSDGGSSSQPQPADVDIVVLIDMTTAGSGDACLDWGTDAVPGETYNMYINGVYGFSLTHTGGTGECFGSSEHNLTVSSTNITAESTDGSLVDSTVLFFLSDW